MGSGSAPGPAAVSVDPKKPLDGLNPSPAEDAYGGRSADSGTLTAILDTLGRIEQQNAQILSAFNGIADGVGSITKGGMFDNLFNGG